MTAENLPPWARMSVGYDGDPKIAGLARFGDDAGLCRDLHLAMIRYSRRNGTDGWVPPTEPGRLAWPLPLHHVMDLVEHLAEAELIAADGFDLATAIAGGKATAIADAIAAGMANGWHVVNYAKWQETAAEVAAYSKAQSERGRLGAEKRWGQHGRAPAIAGAIAGAKRSQWQTDGDPMAETESERETTSSRRNAGAPARPAGADDDDDFHHQIVALLHGSGHAVTYAEAVVIAESLLIGRRPRDPRAYVLGSVRKHPAEAVRLLTARKPTGSRQPPPVNQRCRRCSATDHATQDCPDLGGASAAAGDAAHGAELARKQMAERARPEADEPDLVAAAEEDDRLARQKAVARARDPEPAEAGPGVDDGLPDW
jgi:hypothetical protein